MLDGDHGIVDQLADGGLLGVGLQVRPAGVWRHPEDILGGVFVAVFGVGVGLGLQPAYCSWKASEMYFRKIRPSTTCLYSPASMCPRILSAAAQSVASKTKGSDVPADLPLDAAPLPFALAPRARNTPMC